MRTLYSIFALLILKDLTLKDIQFAQNWQNVKLNELLTYINTQFLRINSNRPPKEHLIKNRIERDRSKEKYKLPNLTRLAVALLEKSGKSLHVFFTQMIFEVYHVCENNHIDFHCKEL